MVQEKTRRTMQSVIILILQTNRDGSDSGTNPNLWVLANKKFERIKLHITKRLELVNPRAGLKMILYHRAKACIFTNSGVDCYHVKRDRPMNKTK